MATTKKTAAPKKKATPTAVGPRGPLGATIDRDAVYTTEEVALLLGVDERVVRDLANAPKPGMPRLGALQSAGPRAERGHGEIVRVLGACLLRFLRRAARAMEEQHAEPETPAAAG